ncbi:hypothetical protein HDZ31DRAFT_78123 [Schizophyllum fasciatum]
MKVARQEWLCGIPRRGLPYSVKSREQIVSYLPFSEGRYRYVYIAVTDTGRKLQEQLGLQPQTDEDLDSGIFPGDDKPCQEDTDRYPVVERHAHPYAISIPGDFAESTYRRPSSTYNAEDCELTPSEASGYELLPTKDIARPDPLAILGEPSITEGDPRKLIAGWTCNKIDPDASPPEEKPIRIEYKAPRNQRRKDELLIRIYYM